MSAQFFHLIVALGCVTIFNRLFGYWMMQFVPLSGRVKAGLEALPPSILIALVAPMVIEAGIAGVLSITVAILIFLRTKNSALAAIVAITSVALARFSGVL